MHMVILVSYMLHFIILFLNIIIQVRIYPTSYAYHTVLYQTNTHTHTHTTFFTFHVKYHLLFPISFGHDISEQTVALLNVYLYQNTHSL